MGGVWGIEDMKEWLQKARRGQIIEGLACLAEGCKALLCG